jgi:enoyl-CoA hydratase
MSESSKVSYARVEAAAVLTITRPERRNAVDDETASLLRDGYGRFEADDEARVLVLAGQGPEAFCAGADLKGSRASRRRSRRSPRSPAGASLED